MPGRHNPIDLDLIKQYVELAPESPTGLRHIKSRGRAVAGNNAGCTTESSQYSYVSINNTLYAAHRIVWALAYGSDPGCMEIDHIDQDKRNNRAENLRLATCAQNRYNQKAYSNNISGYRGVSINRCPGRKKIWRATISVNKKQIDLGHYYTPEEASAAYESAKRKYHGEFGSLPDPYPQEPQQEESP